MDTRTLLWPFSESALLDPEVLALTTVETQAKGDGVNFQAT
ncbi:hypothetical protein [Mycolicibacterium sp. CR10]|nr:hypothetical protein [Mycolicibacterium sp. CR10]